MSSNLSPIYASMDLQSICPPICLLSMLPCDLQSMCPPICLRSMLPWTSNPFVLQSVFDPRFHVSSCLLLMFPRVSFQYLLVFFPMSPRVSLQRLCISPSNVSICLLQIFLMPPSMFPPMIHVSFPVSLQFISKTSIHASFNQSPTHPSRCHPIICLIPI